MNSKLQNIQNALKVALDAEFVARVRKDHASGYLAEARREFAAHDDRETPDGYFFSYGKTERAAVKDLAAQVEQFLRTRLDMCRTGLNTLLATEGRT